MQVRHNVDGGCKVGMVFVHSVCCRMPESEAGPTWCKLTSRLLQLAPGRQPASCMHDGWPWRTPPAAPARWKAGA